MIQNFPFYLSLILIIVLPIMLANKIKVAWPSHQACQWMLNGNPCRGSFSTFHELNHHARS
jgi:hypothetical protein